MKLHFETWLETQKISVEAQASFDESFICFKVGAYRAALLFAYTGFMNIIRDRICSADLPNEYRKRSSNRENQWEQLQKALKDEADSWEDTSFNCIRGNCCRKGEKADDKEAIIFILSDDLRKQVEYWKSRRNDCAHSKPNLIIAAYVESFYAFLESNLGKFAVSGSKLQMQEKILECFDSNRTYPGKSDDELQNIIAHELPNSLTGSEYPDFVEEVISELRKKNNSDSGSQVNKFLKLCLEWGTPTLKNVCAQFLNNSSTEDLANFLREYHDKCTVIKGEDKKIRSLWKTELFKKGSLLKKDVCLFASILNNGLIPEDQQKVEAIEHFITSTTSPDDYIASDCLEEFFNRFLNDKESGRTAWDTLIRNGILDILGEKMRTELFGGNSWRFKWANSHRYFIVKYLEDREISSEIAEIICSSFNSDYNPLELRPVLNDFFSKNEEKKEEFLRLAKEHEIAVPTQYLKSLK